MPHCILRAGGPSFDADAFLKTVKLQPYRIWRVGEPRSKSGRHPNRTFADSGFGCEVSRAEGNLRHQLKDAEAFLLSHRDDVRAITSHPQVRYCDLDFGYYCRLGDRILMQGEYLPPSFLRLVGELGVGVALSLYGGDEDEEDDGG